MVWTGDLVAGRFDTSEQYAKEAIQNANDYMDQLEVILTSLELPILDELTNITLPTINPLDYTSRPLFSSLLENFPVFDNEMIQLSVLEDIPKITIDLPEENITFSEHTYSVPKINIENAPEENINFESLSLPNKPELVFPNVPVLTDLIFPSEPIITFPDFDAVKPNINDINNPDNFNYSPGIYNSDIRVSLFEKILYDLQNGGTGLSVDVEDAIYARGRERLRLENERLYTEIENQFSAIGFGLPNGSYASRLSEISNEIALKNEQLNYEIMINQADLAQKNTQFTTDQARQIEGLLIDFFNQQENRSLEAAKIISTQSIEIFNALISKEKLKLEQYQTEATVFEQKIRAKISEVEVYKAKLEGVKIQSEIQNSEITLYNAQLNGLNILLQLYATEMESIKISSDIQLSKIELFKTQMEAYNIRTNAEKLKVDIYTAQTQSEQIRATTYSEKIKAYQSKIDIKKTEVEIQQMNAENILNKNKLLVDVYIAQLEGYKAELTAELQNAELQLDGFKAETMAYETQTNAQESLYKTQLGEFELAIENAKLAISKQVAIINATKESYVALKSLQVSGTEGMMNANTQLAASALNAVNVSASQGISSSASDQTSYEETHYYKEK